VTSRITRLQAGGAILGIALEVYDFTTFSYFAVAIAHTFFPGASPFVSLMLSLGTVGAGFLARPFGALLIGRYADRVGRRPAMVLSFALMGASVLALSLTPGYAQIGIAAPLLVLTARLTQGFALGGEVGSTTAFLLEAAPVGQRGRYCALQDSAQGLAAVVAGAVGAILASWLTTHALEAYGWRIAMLLGAAVLPLGVFLRRSMPETLHLQDGSAADVEPPNRPARATFRLFVVGMTIIGAEAAFTQMFRYMTTYCIEFLHMNANVALGVQAINGLFAMTFSVLAGALSDSVGRRPVMVIAQALCFAATLPVFYFIAREPSIVSLFGGIAVLSLLVAVSNGATTVSITEALPRRFRSTGFALIYAGALAVFGSSTQPFVTWLIHTTGDPLALGWCALLTAGISLVAKFLLGETSPGGRHPPRRSATSATVLASNAVE
jgi:MFS family permease